MLLVGYIKKQVTPFGVDADKVISIMTADDPYMAEKIAAGYDLEGFVDGNPVMKSILVQKIKRAIEKVAN